MAEFKTKGFKALARKVDKFKGEMKERTRRAITGAVLDVHREAIRRAPVDTGRLRSSLRFEVREDGLAGEVFTNVFYAPFLEFGTKNITKRPFLFPAFEKARKKLVKDLKRL